MLQQYKALAVVMLITLVMFAFVKPLMERFIAPADFAVRRNVWLGLTVSGFLIPYYWAYVLVAAGLLVYGMKRDSNPGALYLFLLLAMPPIGLDVPTLGIIRQFLFIDHLELLSLVLLAPVAWRLARRPEQQISVGLAQQTDRLRLSADLLILAYLGLQLLLFLPYESVTASLRRVVISGTSVWLPYYVLSRCCNTRARIVDAMAAFALAIFVLVPLAAFESVRGWLLYSTLQEQWQTAGIVNYLRRGDLLRAQVTAGHSIVLGFAMSVGFGFWIYLQSRVAPVIWRAAAMLILLIGMAAPGARGPWLGGAVIVVAFLAMGPNRGPRLLKALALAVILTGLALASPYSSQIVERLPFIGTLEEGTITYREQLAQLSWTLISANPWFGTPGFLAYLEEMRQGQGIVDLVNAYAGIALAYGLITLAAFVGFFVLIIVSCLSVLRNLVSRDPDLSLMGASLVACLLGALLMIATVNLYLSISYLVWSTAGLAVGYFGVARAALAEGYLPSVPIGAVRSAPRTARAAARHPLG